MCSSLVYEGDPYKAFPPWESDGERRRRRRRRIRNPTLTNTQVDQIAQGVERYLDITASTCAWKNSLYRWSFRFVSPEMWEGHFFFSSSSFFCWLALFSYFSLVFFHSCLYQFFITNNFSPFVSHLWRHLKYLSQSSIGLELSSAQNGTTTSPLGGVEIPIPF